MAMNLDLLSPFIRHDELAKLGRDGDFSLFGGNSHRLDRRVLRDQPEDDSICIRKGLPTRFIQLSWLGSMAH